MKGLGILLAVIAVILVMLYIAAWVLVISLLWNVEWVTKLGLPVTTEFSNNLSIIVAALAPLMTLLLAIAAFGAIWQNHRERVQERHEHALQRIRSWAEETFEAITRPTIQQPLPNRLNELIVRLQPSSVKSIGILSDAKQLGGSLDTEVTNTNFILNKFIARLWGNEEIAGFKTRFNIEEEIGSVTNTEDLENSKKEVLVALTGVINSVTAGLIPRK